MLLAKKCHFFLYLDLIKNRLEIMLNYFEERKETFFDYKKQNVSKSKKSHLFSYLVYLDLLKIRLAIMLSDFAEKKETFLIKEKNIFFSKGLSYAFGQNMPNSSLFRFGRNKTRNNG